MTYLVNAAKWYNAEPHQIAAWDFLEGRLSQSTLEEFQTRYRASPAPPESPPPQTVEGMFNPCVFEQLTGYSANLFSNEESIDCNELFRKSGFDESPDLASMLMANILHETGNLKWMKELADGWAYEYRSDLGNTQPGDGPRFKGAGVLQLTGRYNYSVAADILGDNRVMEGVDYVSLVYPFQSALAWIQANDLLSVAKNRGFDDVCYRINGGWNGIDDRYAKYNICRNVLG